MFKMGTPFERVCFYVFILCKICFFLNVFYFYFVVFDESISIKKIKCWCCEFGCREKKERNGVWLLIKRECMGHRNKWYG